MLTRFKNVTVSFNEMELKRLSEHFSKGTPFPDVIRLILSSYKEQKLSPPLEFVDSVLKLDPRKFRRERINAVALCTNDGVNENREIAKRIDRLRRDYGSKLTAHENEILGRVNRQVTPPPKPAPKQKRVRFQTPLLPKLFECWLQSLRH